MGRAEERSLGRSGRKSCAGCSLEAEEGGVVHQGRGEGTEQTSGMRMSSVWDMLRVNGSTSPRRVQQTLSSCPNLPHKYGLPMSTLPPFLASLTQVRGAELSSGPNALCRPLTVILLELGPPGSRLRWVSWPKKHVPEAKISQIPLLFNRVGFLVHSKTFQIFLFFPIQFPCALKMLPTLLSS